MLTEGKVNGATPGRGIGVGAHHVSLAVEPVGG